MSFANRIYCVFAVVTVLVATCLFPYQRCLSQSYHFSSFSIEQGLALSQVNTICQDRHGNIWFGTNGRGVSKYNGLVIENFTTNEGLSNNLVNYIFSDSRGDVWFCTDDGISRLKQLPISAVDTSGSYFVNYNEKEGLAGKTVWTMMEDNDSNLWFGTNEGLSKFLGDNREPGEPSFYNTKMGLSHNIVRAIMQDRKGEFWFGTENGLTRYNPVAEPGEAYTYYTTKNGLCNDFIWSILEDSKGNLWFGTDHGISKLSTGMKDLSEVKFECYKDIGDVPLSIIYNIVEVDNGNVWFACLGSVGAIEYSHRENRFYLLTAKEGLTDNNITSIIEDNEGNMWFGTYGTGVSRLNSKKFELYTKRDGLPDNFIWSIVEDINDNIWIANDVEGVSRLIRIPDAFKSAGYRTLIQNFSIADGLVGKRVYQMLIDRNDNIWFCTEDGLSMLRTPIPDYGKDGISKSKLNFKNYTTANGLSDNRVRTFYQDNRGNYWITYWGGGVTKAKFNSNFSRVETSLLDNYMLNDFVTYDILADRYGNLWFATGGGITKAMVNDSTGEIVDFLNLTTKEGLSHHDVRSIVEDKQGNLWFATGGGIDRYNQERAGEKIENFSTEDGMSSNRVYSLIFDEEGNLWAGTNVGIDKFDLAKFNETNEKFDESVYKYKSTGVKHFKNYGFLQGFPGMETNTNAVCLDRDGNLWFGSIRGAVKYYPEEDRPNTKPPVLNIIGVKLFSDLINMIDDLQLNHDQNQLTFTFTGVSHSIPELVRYKYKLEGYSYEWSDKVKTTSVSFSGLPAGDYTFMVKSSNAEGVWNKYAASYSFSIDPPFWQTIWFYSLLVLCFAGLVYSFVKVRLRALKRTADILQEQVEYKTSELQKSELLYRTLFEKIGDSIFVLDKDTRHFLDCNQTALDIYGYTKEELRAMTPYDLHPKKDHDIVKENIDKSSSAETYTYTHITKDDKHMFVEIRSDEIQYHDKRAWLSIVRDITERRKAEKEIERKNKQIMGGIRYSKRILDSILQDKDDLDKLLPQSFILFKPKDIVSGDFYWFSEKKKKIIVGAVDCTGHGVGGAFMSLVGNELLRDIVNNRGLVNPTEILKEMHKGVVSTMNTGHKDGDAVGGMDVALCTIDLKNNHIEYAGAGRPMILIRKNGEEEMIQSNKFPIGLVLSKNGEPTDIYSEKLQKGNGMMEMDKINIEKGDTFYIFTDGYCDQFGGKDNTKFMRDNFRNLLKDIQSKSMDEQEKLLDQNIESWRGENPQVDDILVIGVRI